MKTTFAFVCAAVLTLGAALPATAQNQASDAQFGATPWANLGTRNAAAYNWIIDATGGGNLNFVFPATVCQNALSFGGGVTKNPFVAPISTGITVNITDPSSASNSETAVSFTSASISGGVCTLSLGNANTHTSYKLSSGTCGLQEAINDAISSTTLASVIEFGPEMVALGCSQSTITGLTKGLNTKIYIHDTSNGLPGVWYDLQALNNTAISVAGVALTATKATGGSLTSNGTYLLNYEYVDCLGGIGLANVESATITLTGVQTITTSAVAAATGACGYIPTITASGGSTGTEIFVAWPLTSATCTLSTLTPYPTCAIGSTTFISANPSGTSKQNVESFGHTSVGYLPVAGNPVAAPVASIGDFQTSFLPFVVGNTLNNSNEDLAQGILPANFLNRLGETVQFCPKLNVGTAIASSVLQLTLTFTNNYAQNPVVVSTVLFPTLTLAAAGQASGCFEIQTAVTGTAGQFWAKSPGAWGYVLNSTGTGVITVDNTAAISTTTNAPDLTKQIFWAINATETASHNITTPIINSMNIKPVLSN